MRDNLTVSFLCVVLYVWKEVETTETEVKPKNKVPPIIISNPLLWNDIRKTLSEAGISEFNCKANPESLNLRFQNLDDYNSMREIFKNKNYPFHTFSMKSVKRLKVVLKNMPADVTVQEIKNALLERGYPVLSVYQLKKTVDRQKVPLPIFYLELELGPDGESIYELKDLLNLKIKVEPYRRKKTPTQCHRCQRYGHTQNFCGHPARCVKCSLDQSSCDCKDKFIKNPKCALCGGGHVASFRGCSQFPKPQTRTEEIPATAEPPTLTTPTPVEESPTKNNPQIPEEPNTESIQDFFREFMTWFRGLNPRELLNRIKIIFHEFKQAKSLIEKLEIGIKAFESLTDYFSD